jgi:hypothetical protein
MHLIVNQQNGGWLLLSVRASLFNLLLLSIFLNINIVLFLMSQVDAANGLGAGAGLSPDAHDF